MGPAGPASTSKRMTPKSPGDHSTCVGLSTLRLSLRDDNTLKKTWVRTASATSGGRRTFVHNATTDPSNPRCAGTISPA
eukprot:1985095-Pyramimonas_sp.AAC.1